MCLALAAVMAVIMGILLMGHRVRDWVGDIPIEVLTRLFGLILVAIAVQLVVEGMGQVFPEWINARSVIIDDLNENKIGSSQ